MVKKLIIIMESGTSIENIALVCARIEELGYKPVVSEGQEKTVISVIGNNVDSRAKGQFNAMKGVENVIRVLKPFYLVKRKHQPENTVIDIKGVNIGGKQVVIIAGPESVERRDELLLTAFAVKEAGAKVLRGGAYKVRYQSDELPTLGEEGLRILREAGNETGLHIITEVRNPKEVDIIGNYTDILQIGTLHMQNYELLAACAGSGKPVLLKRGIMSTIEEWLLSAEYMVKRGNPNVILCERGVRTFENYSDYTLDLSSVPIIKSLSHLPVIVDPSHGTGNARYVPAMARAAVAAGADGLMLEVHPHPGQARMHGVRHLDLQSFKDLMIELKRVARAIGREI